MSREHGSDRLAAAEAAAVNLAGISSFGKDTGNGNLLGVQPYMVPADYASEKRFHAKLDGYLARAREEGYVNQKTIVVLPEYLGVWLVAAGEKQSVYEAETVSAAAQILVTANLIPFLRWLPFAGAPQRARRALFQMKAQSTAAVYNRVFSRLAREHEVTIVAGSVLLPDPQVRDGVLVAGSGPLYNLSVVYGADGAAIGPPVRKAFPIQEEIGYLSAGAVEELPVFATPAGRLGVLVCADSWQPKADSRLREQGVQIIVAPCYLHHDGQWEQPWGGYGGGQLPDLEPADVGGLTEAEAWLKYGLPGRMPSSGARAGISVFLRGRFWDYGSDGQVLAVVGNTTHAGPHAQGATLVNLWLGAP
ncbi:MAG: nitrilase-related carbon-nitrogen hydrolase [Planctomycetota bacterium]|jgi:hypothetical protein